MSKVKYAFYETPAGYKVTGGTSTQFLKADGTRDSNTYSLSNHTHTFASLTSKPTTVSGYGITDAISVDPTGALNNVSTTTPANWRNKVWFDYNWAGEGVVGSVISFSGLPNSSYAVELFGNYGDGNIFGLRTRNGDTNQWNSPKFIWHTGNLSPVTTNTAQFITGHKIFQGVGNEEYHNSGLEIRQYNTSTNPTLGFHHATNGYAGTIRLKPNTFEFQNAANQFITLRASGYVVSGANNTGFLKAGGAVDYTAYAINNGLVNWTASARGLELNQAIQNQTLNNLGQTVSLQDATQGHTAGILNNSGIAAGNPTDNWYHRIKMLHPNTAGYYTEIAVQMTGGSTMWFKTLEAGTIRNAATIPSGWIQVVDNLNDQVVRGVKEFDNTVKFNRQIEIYDNAEDAYGTLNLSDSIYLLHDAYNRIALGLEEGSIITHKGGLYFHNNTSFRNYTFPNKNGTVALTSDLPTTVTKTITASTYTVRPDDKDNLIIFTANTVVVTVNNSSLTGDASAVQFEFLGTGTLTCVGSGAQILVNKNRSPVSDGINSTMVLQRLTTEGTSKFKLYGELV